MISLTTNSTSLNRPTTARQFIERKAASFCVPRQSLALLIENLASALEIAFFLVLARFTDRDGRCTSASINALSEYTSTNKKKVRKILNKLLTYSINGIPIVKQVDIAIEELGSDKLSHNRTDRTTTRYILADYGEPMDERVWIGASLVDGFGDFRKPLAHLKHCGDVAARLLVAMYECDEMETFGGVSPIDGPSRQYLPTQTRNSSEDRNYSMIKAKRDRLVAPTFLIRRVAAHLSEDAQSGAFFDALKLLEQAGLIYETVIVLNRGPAQRAGSDRIYIEKDAERLYDLDCLSLHGHKPLHETGLAGPCARTAGDLKSSVANSEGQFDGTYAAFTLPGMSAMIWGVFRLRMRVSNPKCAGIKAIWNRTLENQRNTMRLIARVRKQNHLSSLNWSQFGLPDL